MRNKRFLLALAALALSTLPALADWQADGNMICDTTNNQYYPVICADGKGGAIMAWQDLRNGSNNDIYAQRVNSDGEPQWAAGGIVLCSATLHQQTPVIIPDGTGGAIIAWQDTRSANYDIFAQRVDSAGTVQWTANGVAVCDTTAIQSGPTLVSDGSGGAIITWQDYRSGSYFDIYAQRVSGAGMMVWARNGVPVCDTTNNQQNPAICGDGAGGAIITWNDSRNSGTTGSDIYAQRVNSSGAPQWTRNGVIVCDTTNIQNAPVITSDGSGGAIIAWHDLRGVNYDIYAQRMNSGATQWTRNGVALCTEAASQQNPVIAGDGAGGAIITWNDSRNSGTTGADIYAQRVNSAGAAQWAVNGLAICAETSTQSSPTIANDGAGGAIIAWQDLRSIGYYDIYAQRITRAGAVQWTVNGAAACTATNNQIAPTLASDGAGGAIVVWSDSRNLGVTAADIYTQRMDRCDGSYYGRNAPAVVAAKDIPNDQGGYVNLEWTPSFLDVYPDTTISYYSLWRSLSGAGAKGARLVEASDVTKDFTGPAYRITEKDGKAYAWEWVANVPWKHYLSAYSYTMPTLCDTLSGNRGWHHFFVSAQTDNPGVYWDSYPDSGYSVDNISPAKVKGLAGASVAGLVLTWNGNNEGDLKNYAVYHNGAFVGFTDDTTYTYTGSLSAMDNFIIKAVDLHDNQGPASDPWVYQGSQAVSLSLFTAAQSGDGVTLRWRTESENDCYSWQVERSAVGAGEYRTLGLKRGQGNSSVPHEYLFTDAGPMETGEYLYRIAEINTSGDQTYYGPVRVTYASLAPDVFALTGAYPNPSRGSTTIRYQLPKSSPVRLELYNAAGQLVKTFSEGTKPAGYHQINWNSGLLSNGIYFYKLRAGAFTATKKLVMIR